MRRLRLAVGRLCHAAARAVLRALRIIDNLGQPNRYNPRQCLLRAVLTGSAGLAGHSNLNYEIGYPLRPASRSLAGSARWWLAYEIAF
jgi:hypothetical protein